MKQRPPRRKIMILGSGPNRIGQGIEFDYCCCHASFALRDAGFETIMVNCNPETVSTDYDTSDRLYFEPLTFEDVMNIVDVEKPEGVIVQFGGQTPLNLAMRLHQAGVPIIGTTANRSTSLKIANGLGRCCRSSAFRNLQMAWPRRCGSETGRREDWLSGVSATKLCAGRPGDGHRL